MSELFAPAALSVSELNAMAKSLLEEHFSGWWISGEISNLTRAASGHYYFSLKDDDAQVRCAMFKHAAARLSEPLKEGAKIEVFGKITLYEARGEFQINVNEVRHSGLGALFARYERLKQQLQSEGLFAPERKQKLPENPRAIGIVTSLAAAALRDVVSTLRRRAPDIPVIVYPTAVQGTGSEAQIAQAIYTASERNEVDVLIVCRGGGSIEDLWAFNEEITVRAIAECVIPIVSGVGHETDFTLTDFVADLRAPTPTAAAELVSPNRMEQLMQLKRCASQLQQALLHRYQNSSQKLDWLTKQLQHPARRIAEQKQSLQNSGSLLSQLWQQQLTRKQEILFQQKQLLNLLRPNTQMARQNLHTLCQNLYANRLQYMENKINSFKQSSQLLNAVSPQQILNRGFAMVSDAKGRLIRDGNQLKQGQKLHIRFAQNESTVRVIQEDKQQDLFD